MKKITKLFASIALFAAVVAMSPKSVNVPPGHDTYGVLPGPQPVIDPPQLDDENFFTIENTSGCKDVKLQFWITASNSDGKVMTMPFEVDASSGGLTIGNLRVLFGQPIDLGPIFTINNVSFDVKIGGDYMGYFMYPNAPYNSQTYSSPDKAKPCDCLHFKFDYEQKKILISRPVPPCKP